MSILNFILLQIPKVDIDSIAAAREQKAEALKQAVSTWSLDDFIAKMIDGAINLGIRVIIAAIVFYIGRFLINRLYKIVRTVMIKREFDRSLGTFILSLIKISLLFILVVTIIGILGIETSSFIAIFASAGVAIGMALSGTLQNFAGGVLILFIKPYKIGDFIEFGGMTGTVKEIQIFNTIINTVDNKSIIIPNGQLSTGTINNYSKEEYRRLEWVVGISYGDDVDEARRVALSILTADERVVKKYREDDKEMRHIIDEPKENEPDENEASDEKPVRRSLFRRLFSHDKLKEKALEWQKNREKVIAEKLVKVDCSPYVAVSALADSSVNITIRAWTRSEFFWDVYFSVNEKIYKEFPLHGLNFPFPQMDVRLQHN